MQMYKLIYVVADVQGLNSNTHPSKHSYALGLSIGGSAPELYDNTKMRSKDIFVCQFVSSGIVEPCSKLYDWNSENFLRSLTFDTLFKFPQLTG